MEDNFEKKNVYYNKAQSDAILIDANESYHIWGRGTGKTSGVLAYKYTRNAALMPGSCGFIVQRTYQTFLTRIFPSLVGGFNRLGFERGYDYEVGKPLKGAPLPYEPPAKFDNFIHFRNGSGVHIISQDRAGSSNGLNTDYGGGDEAKYLNYEQFSEETVPTMRANRDKFKDISSWQSLTFLTSMPTLIDQRWILEKQKLVQEDRIKKIRDLSFHMLKDMNERLKVSPKSSNFIALTNKINKYKEAINFYRRYGIKKDGSIDRTPTVYFSKYSSLENIHHLGEDYIRKQMMILSDFQFLTEILNEELNKVEEGFYPLLDIKRHTYEPMHDMTILESTDYDLEKIKLLDSRVDLDCDPRYPLSISIDFGANITCLWVAQDLPNEYRFLKTFYVKHPVLVKGLAELFINYYRNHSNRRVVYAYYGTETERVLNSNLTYPEEFAEYLKKAKFNVEMHYLSQQPTHTERYLFFQKLLDKDWQGKPVTFNRVNCADGLNSMINAETKRTSKGIEKEKKNERNKSYPQEHATHFSDAWDTQIDFKYMRGTGFMHDFIPSH